jgi:predicted amidophosphoribosyltransferase
MCDVAWEQGSVGFSPMGTEKLFCAAGDCSECGSKLFYTQAFCEGCGKNNRHYDSTLKARQPCNTSSHQATVA